jgi:hypothetical protein
MNRVNIIPFEIFKRPVHNHPAIKDQLLESIRSMGINSLSDDEQKIFNTDWNLPADVPRPYGGFVQDVFAKHFLAFAQEFKYTRCELASYWFQQYAKGDFHGIHCHSECNVSSVYYVTLSSDNPKTTFVYRDKKYSFDVKEGDICTFPSFLRHGSSPNQSNEIKTVISMNVNIL